MSAIDDLLLTIFEHKRPVIYADFESWLRASRRFRDFANVYRNKIHAKLKNAKHAGAQDDLRAELQVAALLLSEERFTLEYERYAATKQRGPDFTVNYKGHTAFNVEVRRLPSDPSRVSSVISDKVSQLPPGIINVLWLAGSNGVQESDLETATNDLHKAIDAKQDTFFQKHGHADAVAFAKAYRRLSGIVLQRSNDHTLWLNPQARHSILSDLASTLKRLA
jgi:hypothetical protein